MFVKWNYCMSRIRSKKSIFYYLDYLINESMSEGKEKSKEEVYLFG